jgi:hypothetical protein
MLLWAGSHLDRETRQQVLIAGAGFFGLVVIIMALIIILARWGMPLVMG